MATKIMLDFGMCTPEGNELVTSMVTEVSSLLKNRMAAIGKDYPEVHDTTVREAIIALLWENISWDNFEA